MAGKAESASSASSIGQGITGGSINENSPSVLIVVVVAVVIIFWLWKKGKRYG